MYRDTKSLCAKPCSAEVWDYNWAKHIEGAGLAAPLVLPDNFTRKVDLVEYIREHCDSKRWIPIASRSSKYKRFCDYMFVLYLSFRHRNRDVKLQSVNDRMEPLSEEEKQNLLQNTYSER